MTKIVRIERELLEQVVGLEIEVVNIEESPTSADDIQMHMTLSIDEDDVETSAFGLIFGLSVQSFHDARPRGVSGMHFQEDDKWGAEDMLRHLEFARGQLRFYADYVRGRMMKTTIDIRSDGTVILDTVNRGKSAERWVRTLQGKKRFRVIDGEVAVSKED